MTEPIKLPNVAFCKVSDVSIVGGHEVQLGVSADTKLYTADQVRAAIEADRQARGEPVLDRADLAFILDELREAGLYRAANLVADALQAPQPAEPVKVQIEEIIESVKAYGRAYSMPNTTASELSTRLHEIRALLSKYASPQPQQIPEGYELVPQYLINLCEQLTRWRHCMSYNDSYFGEPEGDLKRIAAEMERAMLYTAAEPKEKP